ncbi:MAG TPA: YceI family protein [Flavobacteriaceae bacterium]|nr:YceI family protein [Flavobacteriaceae bacterium]
MSAFKSDNVLAKKTAMVILPSSYLSIMGKTNVSQFNCDLNISSIDSLIAIDYVKKDDDIHFRNTALLVRNSCFDCGSKIMNNDFLELLKTPEHPNILLNLKEIDLNPNQENQVIAYIDIKVAGVTRPYVVPVILNNNDTLKISGCLDLKLSDFNIPPPKKMLGLVAVKNDFQIHFDLELDECI